MAAMGEHMLLPGIRNEPCRTIYVLLQWPVRGPGRLFYTLRPRLPHIQLCRHRLRHLPNKRYHCLVSTATRTDLPSQIAVTQIKGVVYTFVARIG